jgi:SWI/SNF-related matrix-associated actin-dependent regulator of chromatin subfamily A-like protein 1
MLYGMATRWPVPPRRSLIAALKGKKTKPTLRPFQREDVAYCRKHGYRVLIANMPGTGKTPTALRCVAEDRVKLTPTLIVCPSSVAWNWRREAKTWAPGMTCQVIEGMHATIDPSVEIVICPVDLIVTHQAALLERRFQCLIIDEAHSVKNPESQRGAAAVRLCALIPHRLLLTGTPLVNTLDEMDQLQRLLGFDPNRDERAPMVRRYLEDVAKDVPPKKRIVLNVTIPKSAMAEYTRAEQEFGSYLDDVLKAQGGDNVEKATTAMSAAALVRVGYLRRILGRGKALSAAAWIVRQIRSGEPVVVFAEHKDVLDALAETLDGAGVSYGRVDGSVNRRDRQAAIDGFQNGDLSVFLGSQAAREGITLHRARHLLFVERWWHPASEEQAEDRIRRIGQRHETFIWFMQVPDTYDERMSEIIENKRALVSKHVGSQEIEEQDATGLLGEWLRGQPAGETDLEMPEFPPMPRGTKVHCFLFPVRNWTSDNVRRWLRIHGYRARSITVSVKMIRAELRPAVGYVPGTFQRYALGPDVGAVVGQPRRIRKVVSNRRRNAKRRRMGP